MVVFFKKFIAVIMALVIANPICCCAFKDSCQTITQAPQSCCGDKSGKETQKDSKGCACASVEKQTAPENQPVLSQASDFQPLIPGPSFASPKDFLSELPEAVAPIAKSPPGRLPVATTRARLAGKCSYLI